MVSAQCQGLPEPFLGWMLHGQKDLTVLCNVVPSACLACPLLLFASLAKDTESATLIQKHLNISSQHGEFTGRTTSKWTTPLLRKVPDRVHVLKICVGASATECGNLILRYTAPHTTSLAFGAYSTTFQRNSTERFPVDLLGAADCRLRKFTKSFRVTLTLLSPAPRSSEGEWSAI